MEEYRNSRYELSCPKLTVITPVYNRRATIKRTLDSVRQQTYRDLEYIIIDDGSQEPIDDIVKNYMESVCFPVLFIKKENGGVHTARNCGVKKSRGEYLFFLDSDDELVPHAFETYIKEWEKISSEERDKFREVLALCKNENGKQMGEKWPENINEMPYKDAKKIAKKNHAAHVSMMRADIMRSHPWPEPEQVKFVAESLVWDMLEPHFKKRFVNECLYIYHTETLGSVSKGVHKRNLQYIINDLYRYLYYVNNYRLFNLDIVGRVKKMVYYCTYCHVLRFYKSMPTAKWAKAGLKGTTNKCIQILLWIPSYFASKVFEKKYM